MDGDYDYVIIGSGIFGMWAARLVADAGLSALIIECEAAPFARASYVNQARVHLGYHYPRSLATARKTAEYFERFCSDFDFAINRRFKKIYAISNRYSFTSGRQFLKFCRRAGMPCEEISADHYFNPGVVDAAFETLEYAYDAQQICGNLYSLLKDRVGFRFNTRIAAVERLEDRYALTLTDGAQMTAGNVLNCSYASINQVNALFGFAQYQIKYEIAEVIQCAVSAHIENVGITVMDGPFFSVMPFGLTNTHTLTAVAFTPHRTCYEQLPRFGCQRQNTACTPTMLQNCNTCDARPQTAFPSMRQLARKYLVPDIAISYKRSLFAIKPILLASEVDDSRPTVMHTFSRDPGYTAVLSGKFNTIYDLEAVVP
jgi:glycine/D-amino acid oxidase-like deaminating enzyme